MRSLCKYYNYLSNSFDSQDKAETREFYYVLPNEQLQKRESVMSWVLTHQQANSCEALLASPFTQITMKLQAYNWLNYSNTQQTSNRIHHFLGFFSP